MKEQPDQESQNMSLKDRMTQLENEARMVIPGIKALFGFQLVVVFSDRFDKALSSSEQLLHWIALLCSALSIGLALAPAAYHRQAVPNAISGRLAELTSRWLMLALVPLTFGYVIDFYLIGVLVLESSVINVIATGILFAVLVGLWFVYPQICKKKRC